MHVLLILSPMTNLIIMSSFMVGFYSSALFLVFQVSIKGWKHNFGFKSQKLLFKGRKHKDYFSQFVPLILLFHLCRPIILTINKFSWNFDNYFKNLRKLSQMLCFLEILFWKFLITQKKCLLTVVLEVSVLHPLIFHSIG